jgi:ABC-type multidrug transport system ATPase subunit
MLPHIPIGLDATASFEILTHLNKLADSNRTVVLTIHQPRLEIFHMFHQLVLLSDGKVNWLWDLNSALSIHTTLNPHSYNINILDLRGSAYNFVNKEVVSLINIISYPMHYKCHSTTLS